MANGEGFHGSPVGMKRHWDGDSQLINFGLVMA